MDSNPGILKMTNQEVECLFTTSSTPIQNKWEAARKMTRSLIDLKNDREEALVNKRKYYRNYIVGSAIMLVLVIYTIYFLVVPQPSKNDHKNLLKLSIIMIISGIVLVIWHMVYEKWWKEKSNIWRIEQIFEDFAESLKKLNPLGINTDNCSIDEEYVKTSYLLLATKLAREQILFDKMRSNRDIDRQTLIEAGYLLTDCESEFKRLETCLSNDFGIKPSRAEIFQEAMRNLKKTASIA